ncbi:MAG: M56 family metallopeptidase [Oscillospiraceae bacterium]|nr:M56 family metallopeptidase [Oscillospiraceae bacterium]
MTGLFVHVLNMSISASWLVLAVLLLRLVLRRGPKRFRVLLWGLVALRLIWPFSIQSGLSLIPSSQTISPQILIEPFEGIRTGIDVVDQTVNPMISSATVAVGTEKSGNLFLLLVKFGARIWIVGMGLLLLYSAFSYLRLYRRMETAVRIEGQIYRSDRADSPFVLGILRPRIYLPFDLPDQELEYVVAHERAHIVRKDHWWKPLGFLVLTIHWFNPLMWLAYWLFCRDVELACDERVIRDLGSEERADYTQALLVCSVHQSALSACPLAFGEVGVKQRVRAVLNYRRPAFWLTVLAGLICVCAGICFLTDPKEAAFTLRVCIPAGSEARFVYTEEEISPLKGRITVSSERGLGDTEVVLLPVQTETERAYVPEYLTPGLPVELEAEQGSWYRLGVNVQNATEEEIEVYLTVEDVEIRIAAGEREEVLYLGLNAEVIGMDEEEKLLYVRDFGQERVFGDRCVIDCSRAIEERQIIYVPYDDSNQITEIELSDLRTGDAVILALTHSQKQSALNGSAQAEQIQLSTQRLPELPAEDNTSNGEQAAVAPIEADQSAPISVINLKNGEERLVTTDRERRIILDLFLTDWWAEGAPACDPDYQIALGDDSLFYHSDCGTLIDIYRDCSCSLSQQEQAELSEILP